MLRLQSILLGIQEKKKICLIKIEQSKMYFTLNTILDKNPMNDLELCLFYTVILNSGDIKDEKDKNRNKLGLSCAKLRLS